MTDLRDQLQTSLGDSYVIERELGGGGMSRVFLAEESSLGRRVVVKVLPAELHGGVSIARFRREISLAARLQHPHIVPLLAAGEIDGLPYYTMPFVDGESLRARLSHGELPIPETISILRDVAQALEYAHEKGVTHRDIKPDNVLLAGRSAVLTDLGVAKAFSDATAVDGTMTSVGVALGTPAYMAPEQAAGDPATDHRADIYALGMMAYEMLAGHAPFAGRSMQGMLAAHVVETPSHIASLRPATPPRLAELVMRCVAKRPGDRPQTASEVVRELEMAATPLDASTSGRAHSGSRPSIEIVGKLRILVVASVVAVAAAAAGVFYWRLRSGSSESAIRSVAVLPFENQSGDTSFNYLEDGITDHVRDALNAIPDLTVKARSSSQRMKGKDAREIGARLGVGAVLQGTVGGSRARLHATAELVRTSDDAALWSGTFDGAPNDLVTMQDTITRAIIGKLHLSNASGPGVSASRGARGTTDPEAYDLLLRGRYALDRTDFARAEIFFRQALARDPRFARARAYLAVAQAALPLLGIGPLDSINAVTLENARQALAMDSTVVEAYIAESNALDNDMRLVDAIAPLERALRIDPNHVDVLTTYAQALVYVGRVPEAVAAIQRAHERDPLSMSALGIGGYDFFMSGRIDDGLARLKAAIALDPSQAILHRSLGFVLDFAGKPDSAVKELETAYRLDSATFGGRSNLIFGYAAAGRWSDAERQRVLLERERRGTSVNFEQAIAAIAFGEHDNAVAALERSVSAREPLLWITSLPCDPVFDQLKSSPRFQALLQRLGAKSCPPRLPWPIAARH